GETSRRSMMLNRELNGGSGSDAEIDDRRAGALERGQHRAVQHRTRHARIAPHDDAMRCGSGHRPRRETSRKRAHDLRRQAFADAPANTRDADHQIAEGHQQSLAFMWSNLYRIPAVRIREAKTARHWRAPSYSSSPADIATCVTLTDEQPGEKWCGDSTPTLQHARIPSY